jgi:hypothetical protein
MSKHVCVRTKRSGIAALVIAAGLAVGFAGEVAAQRANGTAGAANATGPAASATARGDGLTTLEPVGEQVRGLWLTDYLPGAPLFFDVEAVRFRPWAKGLFDTRQQHDLEPHARCKASGAMRQFLTPYGVEIVEIPELERIYIFDIGGPHTYREVFMDGRPHPENFLPSNYGHNIGRWDGDVLVIDSVGYNEDFWFERRGLPHTEALHTVERFTRDNERQMTYSIEVEDPNVYTAKFTGGFTMSFQAGTELFEYVCQQANYAHELMVGGAQDSVDRSSAIVP